LPTFLADVCMDCGGCVGICPHDSIDLHEGRIVIRPSCTECDLCVRLCPVEALVSRPKA
jgi:Pyruvate/2-oxoacid:ferredoxin oxidoreductase delta subunit